MLPPLLLPGVATPVVPALPVPEPLVRAAPPVPSEGAPAVAASAQDMEILPLAVVEKRMIMAALRHTGQDVPRAAAILQVNPSTIYRKLHAWRNEPSGVS
jgi:two-component system repressor protein LuxO